MTSMRVSNRIIPPSDVWHLVEWPYVTGECTRSISKTQIEPVKIKLHPELIIMITIILLLIIITTVV